MCGLIGLISTEAGILEKYKKSILTQGLIIDTMRGKHATGLCLVQGSNNDKVSILKMSEPGHVFVRTKKYKQMINKASQINLMLGHNRHATTGGLADIHAHPFKYGNTILTHNGTLAQGSFNDFPGNNTKDLDRVDSYRITASIDTIGAINTLEKLEGAFALTWYNTALKKLHIARNSERPLFLGVTKDKKDMLWASEEWMLYSLGELYDINLICRAVDVGKLYTFDLKNPEGIRNFTKTSFKVKSNFFYDHYSVGHSRKHKQRKDTVLERLGLNKGDIILGIPTSWTQYKSQYDDKGTLKLRTCRENDPLNKGLDKLEITAYNIDKKEYDASYPNHILLMQVDYGFFVQRHPKREELNLVVKFSRIANDYDKKLWFAKNPKTGTWKNLSLVFKSDKEKEQNVIYLPKQPPEKYYLEKTIVPKSIFESKIKEGCLCCGDPIDSSIEDGFHLKWSREQKPICDGCVKDFGEFINDL